MDCLHPIVVNGSLVPCQVCPVCRSKIRNDWSFRLRQEVADKRNCSFFVTLTYDDEHLPRYLVPIVQQYWKIPNLSAGDLYFYPYKSRGERRYLFLGGQSYFKGEVLYTPWKEPAIKNTVCQLSDNCEFDPRLYGSTENCFSKRDIDRFIKYLRKNRPGLRFFLVSEYGGEGHRSHYHMILILPCEGYLGTLEDIRSLIDKVWQRGRTQVVNVTDGRLHYITKYALKDSDQFGSAPRTSPLYPFRRISTATGLGRKYMESERIRRFHINDNEHFRLYVNYGGDRRLRLPRYFKDRIFDDDMRERIREQSPPYDVNYLNTFVDSVRISKDMIQLEMDSNIKDNFIRKISRYGKDKFVQQ